MEHHINTTIARIYGIEEAIILHHFYYWIAKNAANDKHFHDGLYWTYNSKRAYADFFAYMNETKITRVIKHLEDEGIILKGNYNEDKFDKTNWYAITRKGLELLSDNGYEMQAFLPSLQNDSIECVKMNNRASQNESSLLVNYSNNNNETDNNKKENSKKEKESQDAFVEKIYKLYPTRCPVRNTYLGKCSKDKERIRRLLRTYTEEDIERVVRKEIDEKYGRTMMQNFSTFLNNFPDPCSLFADAQDNEKSNNVDDLVINGQIYR